MKNDHKSDYRMQLNRKLTSYRRKFLSEPDLQLNEATTRLMINHLLSDVLGYEEVSEIKPETGVNGGFADYLVEVNKRKLLIIEAKSYHTPILNKHLNQALAYAVLTGTKLILLTNGHRLILYRVDYSRPIGVRQIFDIDLAADTKFNAGSISKISRQALVKV